MKYKFNEDILIEEIKKYVDRTYDQHYATDKYQATDIIIDSGHGTGFCLGNVVKYAKRYGKKGDAVEQRKDIMKIIHYGLIQLYIHDEENKVEQQPAPFHHASIDNMTPEQWDDVIKQRIQK